MNTSTRSLVTAVLALTLAVSACSTQASTPTATPLVDEPSTPTELPPTDTTTPEPTTVPTASATLAAATEFPEPAQYRWAKGASNLDSPIGIANAGDGLGRLFVIEQSGMIRIVKGGRVFATAFLDIQDRVGATGSERGLLGLDFHPNYKENGYFYVNYTDKNGNSVVSRFQVGSNPDIADPASEQKLLGIPQPYPNHNGGSVVFGPDGYLYLGFGDGGSGGDPLGNGQSTNTLLGKILRIDVDRDEPYSIPIDNPFVSGGGEPEIWAYGLRNPWRFSFDSATGDLYIADVGQNQWEEVDFLAAGSAGAANFGWNVMEGSHAYNGSDSEAYIAPVAEYSHGEGCSITGGYVYRGAAMPEWRGVYFYGDYCSGTIWGLRQDASGWKAEKLFETGTNISSFGLDEEGEIYFSDYKGQLYRLEKK